jgi:hypothetical protein
MCDKRKISILAYNVSVQVYNAYTRVKTARFLNGFTVNNTGNTNVIVNQALVVPGQSISFGGNYGEVYEGLIEINFTLPSPAPATPVNQAQILQKYYTTLDPYDP